MKCNTTHLRPYSIVEFAIPLKSLNYQKLQQQVRSLDSFNNFNQIGDNIFAVVKIAKNSKKQKLGLKEDTNYVVDI